jgi:sulfhydrogenase subunit beta (sulfur reductase)
MWVRESPGRAEHIVIAREHVVIELSELGQLIEALARRQYDVIGPTVRDGAMVYDHIESARDLPVGWSAEQSPGHYRLVRRKDDAVFAYAPGPHSWKKYLHPADVCLYAAERHDGTFHILNNDTQPAQPYAFIGVKACELAAIKIQDRVLLGDKYRDPIYGSRRGQNFIVAVQCLHSGPTCFCASMGVGPRVKDSFDLMLAEFNDDGHHRFLVRTGSERGAEVVSELHSTPASAEDLRKLENGIAMASEQERKVETAGLKDLLYRNSDHPCWNQVAERCLTCGNCTMACPTCFCTTVEDSSDVSGNHAERWRRWDSCFSMNFSYIHGGSIRNSASARYRQWLTHKFAAWIDQFGTAGCVGCGRCIVWCPAGIDITEEIKALQEKQNGNS